jgi:hypothetical protein
LAATGARIAQVHPVVAEARASVAASDYQRGLDVATGIRDSLNAAGQGGIDASVSFHAVRMY